MSNSGDSEDTQITFRLKEDLNEQFMLAYRKAALDGNAPADGSRSDALRQLMRAFVNDPSIITKGSTDAEVGSDEGQ